MRNFNLRLAPDDPGAPGSGVPSPGANDGQPVVAPSPSAPAVPSSPPASPPPAAAVVAGPGPTEFNTNLQAQLDEERGKRIEREKRINELEDENRRIRSVTVPAKKRGSGWGTILDCED